MRVYCDNKSAINIAQNLVQHDIIKHMEVDKYFIKKELDSGLIHTPYVSIGSQEIIIKLGMNNIYSPT